MFQSTSIKIRFAVSVGSNTLRAVIGFASGLLIARALNPAGYGDLMFLLGSFVAIRSVLDMGSSSAFFTFLSQRARARYFYFVYFCWLAFQFFITLLLICLIIPTSIFDRIWLGGDREIVLLAFVAAFFQQQVWQTVGQIGEAMRKTIQIQLMNFAIALFYLVTILLASIYSELSIAKILGILIVQYTVATIFACHVLKDDQAGAVVKTESLGEIWSDYWKYCKPLVILALLNFAYDFADKWMLQKFGGAAQQGYFQIASQFAAVSLLATTSILSVFWKEIADAWARDDLIRVAMLYRKVSRGLVMLGAMVSGFLLPWSVQIVNTFLGPAYISAWPVLAVMLLYPIHQSMGQIGGTMFLASGQTHRYMFISAAMMLLSILVTYIMLAPSSGTWIHGLEMGALGLACKMVVLGIVSVNIQAWIIARYGGWKFDWIFQVVGIPLTLSFGYLAKMLVGTLWNLEGVSNIELMLPFLLAAVIYAMFILLMIWFVPSLVGVEKTEIQNMLKRLKARRV